jgi:single-strand DNA-binding protein
MNNLRNKVQLIGHVGQEPEVKTLTSGQVLAKLSLATTDIYKNKAGEKVKETYWHNLVAWGKTANVIKDYVQKGQEIAVEGKLINRFYEDKEGKKHYITEIVVNELLLMGNRKS